MLKVEVKAKHIKQGICADVAKCALALAVLDAVPTAIAVYILNDITITHKDGGSTDYAITKRADEFIDRFDDSKRAKPATFLFKQI